LSDGAIPHMMEPGDAVVGLNYTQFGDAAERLLMVV
jgi:hypothetical protein